MTNTLYKVVFQGVTEGHKPEEVKQNLASSFKASPEKLNALFKGKSVVVKQCADYELALKYKTVSEKAGAICSIETIKESPGLALKNDTPDREDSQQSAQKKMVCPKCGLEQEESQECARCGIIVHKYVKVKERNKTGRGDARDAVPSDEQNVSQKSFFEQLPSALVYPLKGDGMMLLFAGATFFLVLKLLIGVFAVFFVAGYLNAYMLRVIESSANRHKELPDWPGFTNFTDDIVRPFFLVFGTEVFCFIPVIIYISIHFYTGQIVSFSDPLLWIEITIGILYLPMSLLAVALFNNIFNINPIMVVSSIIKIPVEYLVACVFFALVGGFSILTLNYLPASIPYVGEILWGVLSLYFIFVQMHIIGLMYFTNKERLGWF